MKVEQKYVKRGPKNNEMTYGPYNFIIFESIGDAVEFYDKTTGGKGEEAALEYINRGAMIAQQSIARSKADVGASVAEINEAIAHHSPKGHGGGVKISKSKLNETYTNLLTQALFEGKKDEAMKASVILKETQDVAKAVAYLKEVFG